LQAFEFHAVSIAGGYRCASQIYAQVSQQEEKFSRGKHSFSTIEMTAAKYSRQAMHAQTQNLKGNATRDFQNAILKMESKKKERALCGALFPLPAY
jgi:hypothetical protein